MTAFEPIKRLIQFYYQERGKRTIMANKKQPRFKTEAEEAAWWPNKQELTTDPFEEAKAKGKLGTGTVARVARERIGSSPTITIRLAERDLARARTLAAEKGLRYQTYLKMLLHQALDSEERRARRQQGRKSSRLDQGPTRQQPKIPHLRHGSRREVQTQQHP